MSTRRWVVWSLKRSDMMGLVVDEGTEKYAKGAAERRNAAAQRQKLTDAAFVAMPKGVKPTEEDLPPAPPAEVPSEPPAAPRRSLTEIQSEAARLVTGRAMSTDPSLAARQLVAEAYEAGQDETARRYRKLLGQAWGAWFGMVTPEMWTDIRMMRPDLWERLRKAILGEQ